MKIRHGFVSNSSSSSFVCLICGETASGWDLCLKDAEMSSCQRGHLICDAHKSDYNRATLEEIKAEYLEGIKKYHWLSETDKQQKIENTNSCEELQDILDIFGDEFYKGPNCDCPFCTMQAVEDSSMLKYLMKETGKTESQLVNEMRQRFATRDDLSQYLHPTVMD